MAKQTLDYQAMYIVAGDIDGSIGRYSNTLDSIGKKAESASNECNKAEKYNGKWIEDEANALFSSQWASAASAAQNEKEQAEYERIADSMSYRLISNGTSVSLNGQEKQELPFQEIIEYGMTAPLSGGRNGTVTEPDGSTRPTNVPNQLWGTPLPEYAKEPNPVSDGIQQMLQTLVPSWIEETVSDSKTEIAQLIKPIVSQELHAMLGS